MTADKHKQNIEKLRLEKKQNLEDSKTVLLQPPNSMSVAERDVNNITSLGSQGFSRDHKGIGTH